MIVDGLELSDESRVTRHLMDASKIGTEFPSGPADGDVFELSQTFNGNAPGIYMYVGAESRWVVKYPNFDVIPYDVAGAIFGKMNDADIVCRHLSVRSYRIKQGFEGCAAYAAVPGTADVYLEIFRVSRNGTQTKLGDLYFAAAESVGAFVQNGSGDMFLSAGETLMIQAPNPVNQDLADIAFTFAGSLL